MSDAPPTPDDADPSSPETPERRASLRGYAVAFACVVAVLAFDQLTKLWAVRVLADGPINVVGTTVQFALTRNPGSSFSLFQGFTPVLALLAIVIVVVLVRALRRTSDPWMVAGLSLVLAGALGNLVDRLVRDPGFLRGEVVDFIKVGWWPTFNIADSAITIGVILIVIRSFRRV